LLHSLPSRTAMSGVTALSPICIDKEIENGDKAKAVQYYPN
jgi:hypothetical protein